MQWALKRQKRNLLQCARTNCSCSWSLVSTSFFLCSSAEDSMAGTCLHSWEKKLRMETEDSRHRNSIVQSNSGIYNCKDTQGAVKMEWYTPQHGLMHVANCRVPFSAALLMSQAATSICNFAECSGYFIWPCHRPTAHKRTATPNTLVPAVFFAESEAESAQEFCKPRPLSYHYCNTHVTCEDAHGYTTSLWKSVVKFVASLHFIFLFFHLLLHFLEFFCLFVIKRLLVGLSTVLLIFPVLFFLSFLLLLLLFQFPISLVVFLSTCILCRTVQLHTVTFSDHTGRHVS